MMLFAHRSTQKELLDADEIPTQDLHRNLFELNTINTLLGGHAVTLHGLKKLALSKTETYTILDIGSGGGDTLKAIAKWARKHGYQFRLLGVDLKKDCINYAQQFCNDNPEISFIKCDYRNISKLNIQPDIIITSLFCHHLTTYELVQLFIWAKSNANIAFIMNDLHRHWLAYFSIAWLTKLFSKSYLVKHDAKLSVLRGFNALEVKKILQQATILQYSLHWKWAFRWLLIIRS
jgi:2-polyprenyl-3-methyl-5-hydroxy-6-metoxy-1,4-benzoquinol methylase